MSAPESVEPAGLSETEAPARPADGTVTTNCLGPNRRSAHAYRGGGVARNRCSCCFSAADWSISYSAISRKRLLLLAFGAMSIVITVVQETRTERVLEALRDLTSPRALVMRDGERRRIAGREVVCDDLLVLGEGDRIPADAALVDVRDLQIDESLLTGESVPVRKQVVNNAASADHRPGGEDQPFVYSGSLVVRGDGVALVGATGSRSEIGKIGLSLRGLQAEPPRLQQQTTRLVRLCFLGGAVISLAAVVLYGALRGDWLQALLAGVAIGMSMLPEEFGVVLTVFMAMGAWRISKARVLTRRAAAIEVLGSATVLCTDKTGTLTQNRMSVEELRLLNGASDMRPAAAEHGEAGPEFVELARCRRLGEFAGAVRPDGEGSARLCT